MKRFRSSLSLGPRSSSTTSVSSVSSNGSDASRRRSKAVAAAPAPAAFAAPLVADDVAAQLSPPPTPLAVQGSVGAPASVPAVVTACVRYLTRYGLDTPQLFTHEPPALAAHVESVRASLNHAAATASAVSSGVSSDGSVPDLLPSAVSSPLVVAILLKQWFQQLPEAVIPAAAREPWLHVASLPGAPLRVPAARLLLRQLPRANRHLLAYLIQFLAIVAVHHRTNGMSVHVLARTWAPYLLHLSPSQATDTAPRLAVLLTDVLQYHDDVLRSACAGLSIHQALVYLCDPLCAGTDPLAFDLALVDDVGLADASPLLHHALSAATRQDVLAVQGNVVARVLAAVLVRCHRDWLDSALAVPVQRITGAEHALATDPAVVLQAALDAAAAAKKPLPSKKQRKALTAKSDAIAADNARLLPQLCAQLIQAVVTAAATRRTLPAVLLDTLAHARRICQQKDDGRDGDLGDLGDDADVDVAVVSALLLIGVLVPVLRHPALCGIVPTDGVSLHARRNLGIVADTLSAAIVAVTNQTDNTPASCPAAAAAAELIQPTVCVLSTSLIAAAATAAPALSTPAPSDAPPASPLRAPVPATSAMPQSPSHPVVATCAVAVQTEQDATVQVLEQEVRRLQALADEQAGVIARLEPAATEPARHHRAAEHEALSKQVQRLQRKRRQALVRHDALLRLAEQRDQDAVQLQARVTQLLAEREEQNNAIRLLLRDLQAAQDALAQARLDSATPSVLAGEEIRSLRESLRLRDGQVDKLRLDLQRSEYVVAELTRDLTQLRASADQRGAGPSSPQSV